MNYKVTNMILSLILFLIFSCTSKKENNTTADAVTNTSVQVNKETNATNIVEITAQINDDIPAMEESKPHNEPAESKKIVQASEMESRKINRVQAVKKKPNLEQQIEEKPAPKKEVKKEAKLSSNRMDGEIAAVQTKTVPQKSEPKEVVAVSEKMSPEPTKVVKKAETPISLHASFDQMAQKYISAAGVVNYSAWKSNESELDAYLKTLAETNVADLSKNGQMAFWINLYNAGTIKLILDNYPVASIRDIDGGDPWKRQWIAANGKTLSLNNIEHDILRPQFKDARIHFAVNCAAKSCPPVWNRAWTESNVQSALENRTKEFLTDTSQNKINPNAIEISKIMEWYRGDFGNLISFINPYVGGIVSPTASIGFLDYDWSLNGK